MMHYHRGIKIRFRIYPAVALTLVLLTGSLVLGGCGGSKAPELLDDSDPIVSPSKTPPVDEPGLFGENWTPAMAPDGQSYNTGLTPKDILNSPFASSIERLVRYRLVPLDDTGLFRPDESLTRGEALLWLYNAKIAQEVRVHGQVPAQNASGAPAGSPDSDPNAKPYFRVLTTLLAEKGYLAGYDDFLRHSNQPITREEMAALVWIFTGKKDDSPSVVKKTLTTQPQSDSGEGDGQQDPGTPAARDQSPLVQLEKRYGESLQGVNSDYMPGVAYLAMHHHGDLYQQVFLHTSGPGPADLDAQAQVRRGEGAALIDQIQHDFEAQAFTNQKPSRPDHQTSYSHSSGAKTEALDPAPEDPAE